MNTNNLTDFRPIKVEQDVRNFFSYLFNELHLNFHPDDEFHDFIESISEKPLFSGPDSRMLENTMAQCHTLCDVQGLDIYEIAIEVCPNKQNEEQQPAQTSEPQTGEILSTYQQIALCKRIAQISAVVMRCIMEYTCHYYNSIKFDEYNTYQDYELAAELAVQFNDEIESSNPKYGQDYKPLSNRMKQHFIGDWKTALMDFVCYQFEIRNL